MTITDPPPGWNLPPDWTEAARDLFLGVLDERPALAGAELAALEQAAALASSAERLDVVAQAAGMIATGSTGQTTVHPAVVESRLARTAAAQILARLKAPSAVGVTASVRGRKSAAARWNGPAA